jgi:hypothetical protein
MASAQQEGEIRTRRGCDKKKSECTHEDAGVCPARKGEADVWRKGEVVAAAGTEHGKWTISARERPRHGRSMGTCGIT